VDAHEEAHLLFLVGDRKPVFDQDDAGAHEHALELRHVVEELLHLIGGGETHDALDAGAVVPRAVEEHDLAARRQVRHITLEIPLAALALGRSRQRHHAGDARVEPLGDALDHATLAGGIAAFEKHHDLGFCVLHPVLQLDQLRLQPEQLAQVGDAIDRRRVALLVDVADRVRQRRLGQLELQRVGELGLQPVQAAIGLLLDHHALHRLAACLSAIR
jgi:hypothetical protein